MKQLRVALIGAGNRGTGLAALAVRGPRPAVISALVDPREDRRRRGRERYGLGPDRLFADHRELLERCRDLDGAIIATEVRTHARIARDCLEAGVPIFLEKPMTRTIQEAIEVADAARRTAVPMMIGFNLRYAPFFARIKELIDAGAVGAVVSIEWKEVLSPRHWADGYCRATWYSRQEAAGGWLLEKSCHDIDQINWLAGAPCARVASFGSRRCFLPRPDVPQRCTDGCPIESQCYYSCLKFHPDGPTDLPDYVPNDRWDLCVYHCGADLVDRQVAILEYENGVAATFSLIPAGFHEARVMRISGSEATIRASSHADVIHLHRHDQQAPEVVPIDGGAEGGHGGGDPAVVQAFLDYLADPSRLPRATVDDAVESMLAAGGIELARAGRSVVELAPLRDRKQGGVAAGR